MAKEKQNAMFASAAIEVSSFAFNLWAALMANSLTLWTNTLRVGLDSLATLFAYYVTRRIAAGSKERFDYGLGKWENLSAMINVLVMLAALVYIAWRASVEILRPHHVTGTGFGLGVLAVFLALNLWLLIRFWRLLKTDPSPVVRAQFVLYRNASLASFISFVAVAVPSFVNNPIVDTWIDVGGSLVLGGIILYGVVSLARQSLSALLDEALEESLQLKIMRALAETFDDYAQFHDVRSRRSGDQIFVDLFLEFEPGLAFSVVQERSRRIKHAVEELVPKSEASIVIAPAESPS